MESNFVSSIPGIEFYPIVALIFFFTFFSALLAWFFLHDRERLRLISLAPFDGEADHDALDRQHGNPKTAH